MGGFFDADSGEGARVFKRFVLFTRVLTASESSSSSSSEDAEPDRESSKPESGVREQSSGRRICAPSNSCENAVSETGCPPVSRVFTLYRCRSDRKCARCSSTSRKILPWQIAHALGPALEVAAMSSGLGGRVGVLFTRFRGVKDSKSSAGSENRWCWEVCMVVARGTVSGK